MEASKKKLFIGLPINIEQVEASIALAKMKATASKKKIEINWVSPENLHVTLKFLGVTPKSKINPIIEKMNLAVKGIDPFKISIRGVGAFPDLYHPRVLWLGVQHKQVLNEIKETMDKSMNRLGYGSEDREYSPHLTVGRLRKRKSVKDLVSPFVRKEFGKVKIESLVLFESFLGGHFPLYKKLAQVNFETETSLDRVNKRRDNE